MRPAYAPLHHRSSLYKELKLIGVYLARNFTNHKRIVVNNQVEQNVVFDLRSDVYRSLQSLSLKYFENGSTGELMSRVNDDVNLI